MKVQAAQPCAKQHQVWPMYGTIVWFEGLYKLSIGIKKPWVSNKGRVPE